MSIDDAETQAFTDLWKNESKGDELSEEEARDSAAALTRLTSLLHRMGQ
jgi:hypothetical protein